VRVLTSMFIPYIECNPSTTRNIACKDYTNAVGASVESVSSRVVFEVAYIV